MLDVLEIGGQFQHGGCASGGWLSADGDPGPAGRGGLVVRRSGVVLPATGRLGQLRGKVELLHTSSGRRWGGAGQGA